MGTGCDCLSPKSASRTGSPVEPLLFSFSFDIIYILCQIVFACRFSFSAIIHRFIVISGFRGGEKGVSPMRLDDISVRMAGDHLELSGDPKVLRDVGLLLEHLTDLTRYLKKRMEHVSAERAAELGVDKARHEVEYAKETVKIYGAFLHHLNNGCAGDKKAARNAIRQEFKLLAVDVDNYIAAGKRLERQRRVKQCATA